jgi:opine dehydrogenase
MKITILGAGAIGKAYAAYLSSRGHAVTIWSPSGRDLGRLSSEGVLTAAGICEGTYSVSVAKGAAEAGAGAELIVVAVPANGHAAVIDDIVPHLADGQTVIVSAELSMSSVLLANAIKARGLDVPVIAWATTVVTAKSSGQACVIVSLLRKRLDVAAIPASGGQAAAELCAQVFGVEFDLKPSVMAIALSNLNPPAHMAIALCNFTRMEKGEDWSSYGGITEGVGRLMEALDRERRALAEAFGLSVRSVFDHYVNSFGVERASVGTMAQAVATARPHVKGPATLDTRFVTEDVPFGLLPLVELGRHAGIAMPLHESGVELFSALYGRDFRSENGILDRLNLQLTEVASIMGSLA